MGQLKLQLATNAGKNREHRHTGQAKEDDTKCKEVQPTFYEEKHVMILLATVASVVGGFFLIFLISLPVLLKHQQ